MARLLISWSAWLFIGVAIAAFIYPLAAIPILPAPSLGHRGVKRRLILEKGGSFSLIEPEMRLVASWIVRLRIASFRENIETILIQAGDYLGITPDEFLALSALSTALFTVIGWVLSRLLDAGLIFSEIGALGGALLPYLQVQGQIKRRYKQINRGLPAAIDLAALCMGAGLDFPGALRLIVYSAGAAQGVVEEELGRVLQELEVGHTRRQALEGLQRRAPTESVRDFVTAVVQAEQKGSPLAEVLQIQAQVLRMHRSVAAEEAAARAGVMMMLPLLLLLACILLVLLGPLIVNGLGQ